MGIDLRDAIALIDAQIERERTGKTLADQAADLRADFHAYVRAAWPLIVPAPYIETYASRAICEHFQAAADREIDRLLVTVPPGYAKSSILSVFGPTWVWTRRPEERILSGSHGDDLATRDTTRSRRVMQTGWWQRLFGDTFAFSGDENLKTRYSNDRGGYRVRTHVGGGTGDRGTLLILDDPHNADEIQSRHALDSAWVWWGNTWLSRLDDTVEERGVMVVVGQRIGEGDLIGRLLATSGDRWTHLCLPIRYDPSHPYVTPRTRTLRSGREIQGDPRVETGELLAPAFMDEERLRDKTEAAGMTRATFAAQYQQNPTSSEGTLLRRAGWRYYPASISFYGADRLDPSKLPAFRMIVHSWDTSVKDRASSDFVSGQVWAIPRERLADRWLLRLYHRRAGLNETIEAMIDLADWSTAHWPDVRTYYLIENAANGPDAIREIRSRLQGVEVYDARGTKYQRAEAASPALDGRNLVLPGYANETGDDYDAATPTDVQAFVEELTAFDTGPHDDQVDAWSQMVNWTRQKGRRSTGTISRPRPIRVRT